MLLNGNASRQPVDGVLGRRVWLAGWLDEMNQL